MQKRTLQEISYGQFERIMKKVKYVIFDNIGKATVEVDPNYAIYFQVEGDTTHIYTVRSDAVIRKEGNKYHFVDDASFPREISLINV
jgi:hypothetical protein